MKNAHNINDRFTGSEAAPEGAVRPSFPLIDTSAGTFPGPAPPTPHPPACSNLNPRPRAGEHHTDRRTTMTLTKNTEILRAAAAAAADSVNAATYAASVAKAAEAAGRARLRQRDTLLALIAAA